MRSAALGDALAFESPGTVRDDARVGVHVPLEPQAAAEQVGHDLPGERHAERFERDAAVGQLHGHAVVGHHRRHAGVDGGLERLDVLGEPARRVHLALAEREVRIEAELLRSASGEVLDRERHGSRRADRAALEVRDEHRHDLGGEVRVLGEALVHAVPARLSDEVGHVAVHAAQADRPPLVAHRAGEVGDERHVPGRGEASLLGPLRERTRLGVDAEPGVAFVVIARVRLEEHRDPEARRLGHLLDLVRPGCGLSRRDRGAAEPAAPASTGRTAAPFLAAAAAAAAPGSRGRVGGDYAPEDESRHLLGVDVVLGRAVHGAAGAGIERVDEHHPGLLVERHLRHEVGRARGGIEAPILVPIQPSVRVEVLEAKAVDRDDGLHPGADVRLGPR